ncbi:hypothetical protein [Aquimarina aquimarini]|uniref:hypothetical protein n=1 Tax=Aquimarina aquimarini TaxID=1191734 RepID=UPI000D54C50C|nr:hypothetical protein [Aquimarina aquimarini]
MEKSYSLLIILIISLCSCKRTIQSQESNLIKVNHKDLVGHTFFFINEGIGDEKYVLDRCQGVSVDKLRFKENEIQEYTPLDWAFYKIIKTKSENDIISYELKTQIDSDPLKKERISYDPETGLLKKEYSPNKFMIYIDSLKLFNKNTHIKYVKESCETKLNHTDNYANEKLLGSNSETYFLEDFIEKDFYVYDSISGHYDNDSIKDKILIIDISDDDSLGGKAKEDFVVKVLKGSSEKNKFQLLFQSNSIIPCNYCDKWSNDAEYSFSDLKLENGIFSFETNNNSNSIGIRNKFIFKYTNSRMVLFKIDKEIIYYTSNDKKEITQINNPPKTVLKDFNVYRYNSNVEE